MDLMANNTWDQPSDFWKEKGGKDQWWLHSHPTARDCMSSALTVRLKVIKIGLWSCGSVSFPEFELQFFFFFWTNLNQWCVATSIWRAALQLLYQP